MNDSFPIASIEEVRAALEAALARPYQHKLLVLPPSSRRCSYCKKERGDGRRCWYCGAP